MKHCAITGLTSKLPSVGTTIFSVMSALANEYRAVNLGQGFPDFPIDRKLIECSTQAMLDGHNQYPPMAGWPKLREKVAEKTYLAYGAHYDFEHEVTITAGATQAIFTAVMAFVGQGDEVIIIEPAYDCYAPAISLAGGVVVRVQTAPQFQVDWDGVRSAINAKTRMIILNTPNNPSTRIFNAADIISLKALVEKTNIIVLSDEVYEHLVFEGKTHQGMARHPDLAARSVIVGSFGKTFSCTGWKVGTVLAPRALMEEFRRVHQFNVFTVNTPAQVAIANYMDDPEPWQTLADFYAPKRQLLHQALTQSRLTPIPSEGTFFQLARYDAVSDLSDVEFARWLTIKIGVAAIPLSAFYQNGSTEKIIRFCFAKKEDTLQLAAARLAEI